MPSLVVTSMRWVLSASRAERTSPAAILCSIVEVSTLFAVPSELNRRVTPNPTRITRTIQTSGPRV